MRTKSRRTKPLSVPTRTW